MIPEVGAFGRRNVRRSSLRRLALTAATAAFAVAATPSAGATGYNESAGDLSNSNTSPTLVTFGVGDNFITGTTGSTSGVIDRDYFTFTLAPGEELTAIMVLDGTTSIAGPDPLNPRSFIGVEAGGAVTDPAAPVVGDLLGYTHYGPSLIGTDILDNIGSGAGAQGFTGSLGAGTYSVWIQEANAGTANYAFNFLVRSVPEPSTWAMMLAGFGLIGWSMRRRRAQKDDGPSSARSLAI